MSWFDRLIPGIKRPSKLGGVKSVPEGVWRKCESCGETAYDREFSTNFAVCPKCGFHHQLTPEERVRLLLDKDADKVEIGNTLRPWDFLRFTDLHTYKERLERHAKNEPGREALRVFRSQMSGHPVVLACFDFSFMGGSMGSVVGERFVRGVDAAIDHGGAFIVMSSSGGARMQEGLTSLMQMAKTTAAQAKLAEFRLPFISVLCNPTTGGVAASFAMTADVIIAEPHALVGFAGRRVIEHTVREKLPEDFQHAEFLLEHGSVDMIVPRSRMRAVITSIVAVMLDARAAAER